MLVIAAYTGMLASLVTRFLSMFKYSFPRALYYTGHEEADDMQR